MARLTEFASVPQGKSGKGISFRYKPSPEPSQQSHFPKEEWVFTLSTLRFLCFIFLCVSIFSFCFSAFYRTQTFNILVFPTVDSSKSQQWVNNVMYFNYIPSQKRRHSYIKYYKNGCVFPKWRQKYRYPQV